MVSVGDHYRHEGGIHRPGTYRVVGAAEPVVLLRLTDGDGRRRATGEVVRVDRPTLADAFAPAEDPDAGFTPVRALRNVGSGLYWSVRRFL